MAQESLAGFDHTRHRDEVVERWGQEAYDRGDQWWQALSVDEQSAFAREHDDIAAGFGRANAAGQPADSAETQALAERHYAWLTTAWQDRRPTAEQYAGLGQMYVDDPRPKSGVRAQEGAHRQPCRERIAPKLSTDDRENRYAKTYDRHGAGTAAYVRDAVAVYAERHL